MNFFGTGSTGPCCEFPVLAHPSAVSGMIEVFDCNSDIVFATGVVNTINGDASCDCTVPTEETTWGGIKAIYEG